MNSFEGINVLSLFDGMSCGQLALKRIGIIPDNYFASEIKTDGISVTMSNFPNTKQVGDVTKLDGKSLGKIDLLIGGSPCQDLSIATHDRTGLSGIKSKLFYEYVRLLKETNPTYFLLENVVMKPQWVKTISLYLKTVEPHRINSDLVSAQNRPRLYWTNLIATEIQDKRIALKDILTDFPKRCYRWLSKVQLQKLENKGYRYQSMYRVLSPEEKAGCVSASGFCNSQDNKVRIGDGIRYLTNEENERLQTLPYGYTSGIPESKRKHCIGNGWTVDVIAEFFKKIGMEVYKQEEMFRLEELN